MHNPLKVNNIYRSEGVANDVLDNQVVISSNVYNAKWYSVSSSFSYNWITTKVVTTRHVEHVYAEP